MPLLLLWALMACSRLNLPSTLAPNYIQVFAHSFPFTYSYKIIYGFLFCPIHAMCNTISSTLIWLSIIYVAINTNHNVPHSVILSSFLSQLILLFFKHILYFLSQSLVYHKCDRPVSHPHKQASNCNCNLFHIPEIHDR